MSAIIIDLPDYLRKCGMADESIRDIAQAVDRCVEERVQEALREAKAREEHIQAEIVPVEKYHEHDQNLATREDFIAGFAEIRADLAEIRKDLRAIHRLLVIAIVGEFAGFALILFKLYFPA